MGYQVGDTVYADRSRYSTVNVCKGEVVKVTPTGRINVDFGMKYLDGSPQLIQFKGSLQVGGDNFPPVVLISEAQYVDLKARQEAEQAVADFRTHGNYPPIFKNKSDILGFVKELQALADKIPDAWEARR